MCFRDLQGVLIHFIHSIHHSHPSIIPIHLLRLSSCLRLHQKKHARQRANMLQQMETEATTISESLSTPAPTSFTTTYSPLSISYPEPVYWAAHLLSDAVQVTCNKLAIMLHQSYIHGTEHGWKANMDIAREHLQVEYEKDMQDGGYKICRT